MPKNWRKGKQTVNAGSPVHPAEIGSPNRPKIADALLGEVSQI